MIHKHVAPVTEAIAREAKRGYGLLLIGVAKTRGSGGSFHVDLTRIVASFEGPLAVVAARGPHLREPEESPLNILLPVNGTEVSRRAAEVAIAIAAACRRPLAALYVTTAAARDRPRLHARQEQLAVIDDVVGLDHVRGELVSLTCPPAR